MMFLLFICMWLIGMFYTEVFMKVGLRQYCTKDMDQDMTVPIVIFWPIAIILYTFWQGFIFINYLTKVQAKFIRQKILKND